MLSLSGLSPAPGENLVAIDSLIEFTIVDDGNGIDISTLIVEFRGSRAMEQGFKAGFDGSLSSITESDGDYSIVIHPTSELNFGKNYDIKIQVKNNIGEYFNSTYSFKTIPTEPVLISASPLNNQLLTSPQILSLEFDDIIENINPNSITISINGLNYIENGNIISTYNGNLTAIDINGTSADIKIDTIESLNSGDYVLKYQVADVSGNTLISEINFKVNLREKILPNIFPQTQFLGFFQGITKAIDIGHGDSIVIQWSKPLKRNYKNEVFLLIYQNQYRLNVFDNPVYLATSDLNEVTIDGLNAGEAYSFGVRALEFPAGLFLPNGMEELSQNFFRLPLATNLSTSVSSTDLILEVDSVEGYPDSGFLLVDSEVIYFNSVDRINNRFIIPTNGRGLLNTIPGGLLSGDEVRLFLACTDQNTVIVMSTPTHQDGYGFNRVLNEEGVVVSDFTDNDSVFFQGFDFCGWHDPMPNLVLGGKRDCGSYLGGEVNGFRGFDLYERLLNQEEVLLNTTGEPVILLKRIWDGKSCDCLDPRKMSPKMKSCPECYGTQKDGGYTQYIYPRRADGRILVHFNESPEDLLYGEKEGLQQDHEPSGWTLPSPAVKDRDVLVRFDLTEDITFFYEILNVSREVIFNRKYGRQNFTVKRLDKTDILYTYPLDLTRIK